MIPRYFSKYHTVLKNAIPPISTARIHLVASTGINVRDTKIDNEFKAGIGDYKNFIQQYFIRVNITIIDTITTSVYLCVAVTVLPVLHL